MTAKTQHTASSKTRKNDNNSPVVPVIGGRRVEDQLRLRELELQTTFQIQTLTESLNLLKTDFTSWRDSLNDQLTKVKTEVDGLKTRLTVVIALILFEMAGAPSLLTRLAAGGL